MHTHTQMRKQMGEKIDRMKRAERWIEGLNKMPAHEQDAPLSHKISKYHRYRMPA